jgi:excisionase family DNA binding protein
MPTEWLTVQQIADELQVTIDTVRNWIHLKKDPLTASKLGRDWRIKREDLDEFLAKRTNVRKDNMDDEE